MGDNENGDMENQDNEIGDNENGGQCRYNVEQRFLVSQEFQYRGEGGWSGGGISKGHILVFYFSAHSFFISWHYLKIHPHFPTQHYLQYKDRVPNFLQKFRAHWWQFVCSAGVAAMADHKFPALPPAHRPSARDASDDNSAMLEILEKPPHSLSRGFSGGGQCSVGLCFKNWTIVLFQFCDSL